MLAEANVKALTPVVMDMIRQEPTVGDDAETKKKSVCASCRFPCKKAGRHDRWGYGPGGHRPIWKEPGEDGKEESKSDSEKPDMFPLAVYWLTLLEASNIRLKDCYEDNNEFMKSLFKTTQSLDILDRENLEEVSALLRRQHVFKPFMWDAGLNQFPLGFSDSERLDFDVNDFSKVQFYI